MALLQVNKLSKRFGGLTAVEDLSFEVQQGEIMGLIGPNGAGKTTSFNLISGALKATGGEIVVNGEDLTDLRADQMACKGVIRSFQSTTLFEQKTVRENISVGCHMSVRVGFWGCLFGGKRLRLMESRAESKMDSLLEFLDLVDFQKELAGNLPHGCQKRLGVGIALAASPLLLLLDETLTGMNPTETEGMVEVIRKIRDSGVTILLVEHHMRAVMTICDRIIVVNYGRKIAEGVPGEITKNKDVIEAYLGGDDGS